MAVAPSGASRLPDLAKCLFGDEVVLSWDDVLKALLSHDAPPSDLHRRFYAANSAIISQNFPSFGPPNPASRSEFDKAVTSVNVPSEALQKELEKIKGDALWLSHHVNLEEVESLRVVLVEWQNRPELRLSAGFADAELASLRDALGSEYAQTLDLIPGGAHSRMDDDFDSADARKSRILQTFYRSQTSMLALAREALQATISTPHEDDAEAQWQSLFASYENCALKDAIVTTTSTASKLLEELPKERTWEGIAPEFVPQLETDFATCKLQCVAIHLQILLLRAHIAAETVTADMLQEWLSFDASYDHFAHFPSDVPAHLAAVELIRSMASYICLALIAPGFSLAFLDDPAVADASQHQTGVPFLLDYDKLRPMFEFITLAAMSENAWASPTVLAWGLIFSKMKVLASGAKHEREARQVQKAIDRPHLDAQNRRLSGSSIGSTGESLFEQIINDIPPMNDSGDTLQFLLASAVRGSSVFEVLSSLAVAARNSSTLLGSFQLQILQDLLAAARIGLGYTPELFDAQLALLSSASDTAIERGPFKPLVNFIGDPFLREHFLDAAALRFPYEALPLLQITKLLANARNQSLFRDDGFHYIAFRLQTMQSFTQAAIGGFDAYHTTHEDENANLVALHRSVGIVDRRPTRLLTDGSSAIEEAQIIPQGAVGKVISDSSPPVIRWEHSYSALTLIGKWLELHVKGELANVVSPFESASDVAAATIGLLAVLLNTTYSHGVAHRGKEDARQLCQTLLEETSSLLESERDVVDCVFDLIEQQLVSTRRFSPASGGDLLAACIDLVTVLCKVRPLQVWPLLVKSSALAAHGAKRSVFAVIASVEVPLQRYALLESCSKLLQAMIDLVVTVATESDVTRGLKARSAPAQRPLATAVLGLTETMYAAFEALPTWSFLQPRQKEVVLGNLCDAFANLLYRSFGIGPAYDSNSNITICYRPAADFLLNALSGTGVQSLGSGPIALNLVSSMLKNLSDDLAPARSSHLRSLLLLARAHLGSSRVSGHALKEVNTTLVSLFPAFVRLPLMHASLLRPSLALECDIFDAFGPGSAPHLLGHLGSLSCLSFLDSLRYLNARAFEEVHISWRLISRLITLDQQWTAVVLITGSPPGRERKDCEPLKLKTRGKPILEQALDKLVHIDSTEPTVAVALLKLLTEAQQSWPSVTDAITARTDLFPALINYVSAKTSYDGNHLSQALHNQVAAGVTDLSVISLHAMIVFRDESQFVVFRPLLKWLTNNALQVGAYNTSMHANLKKNFAKKYDGLDVSIIQRTGVLRVPYGANYFYDLDFADKMLEDDPHWNNGPQSFRAEFQRANINLSVVDSELTLLRSFKYLCSEHGMFFAKHKGVQHMMARIVKACLQGNCSPTPPEALFDTLALSRVEIAAMILGPLVTVGATGSDFTELLRLAYDTARERNGSYELAIINDDLTYWRSVLNVVRLCMQFHVTEPKAAMSMDGTRVKAIDQSNSLFCEIAAQVVGEGLQSVVAALRDQEERVRGKDANSENINAEDVLLLLNTFQTMLRLPSLPQFTSQLASALISTSAAQSLLLLFSWSHLLDATPVYGVLAARFLAAISKLAPVAEELAVEGVFNSLLLAKMTQKLQKMPHGVGHLDRRTHASMLYTIWSDGFLRIALNLLDAIGAGVAVEASGFINQFPEQLARSSLAFSSNPNRATGSEGLTLGAACELANLSLLSFILERLRMAGASSAVDPTQITPLAGFDEHKMAIAADIKDVLNQELHFRLKREVPTNDMEALWAKSKSRSKQDGKQSETVLDQRMMKQLTDARRCLVPEDEE